MIINTLEYINEIGMHDNNIIAIKFIEHNVEIHIDNIYANINNDNKTPTPGKISIINCFGIFCDNLTSRWITNAALMQNESGIQIQIILNTGAKLNFLGQEIIIEDTSIE